MSIVRVSSKVPSVPESHRRDCLNASVNAYSGLQSSMRDRFVPSGERACARGLGGSHTAQTARRTANTIQRRLTLMMVSPQRDAVRAHGGGRERSLQIETKRRIERETVHGC